MDPTPDRPPSTRHSGATILVVDDDQAMREMLEEDLAAAGYLAETAAGGRPAIERVRRGGVDLVVTDIRMPDLDGLDLLREIRAQPSPPHVITITAFGSIDTAIRAVRLGAYDYITKPFEFDQLELVVERALEERGLRQEVQRLQAELERPWRLGNLIGRSPAIQAVFALVPRVAASDASVLITGESGAGKEVIARAIHAAGPRAGRPFVGVSCAAIPDTLLESELFGVKRGAFTDARVDRAGLFVEADGGTLFLDEVAEMSPPLQAKLLRAIQEREVRPLGASRSEKVDVRIVAATNRDLPARMREGRFREDLYYQLNVIQLALPPLRARPEDVMPLAEHFLGLAAHRARKRLTGFSSDAARTLLAHRWPGNVRELENCIERAAALAPGPVIEVTDLPSHVREPAPPDLLAGALARGLTLEQLEREYIRLVLEAEGGNKTRAAARLGLDRKTLYRKLEEDAKEGGVAAAAAGATAVGDAEDEGEGR